MKTTLLFLSLFLSTTIFSQVIFVDNFGGVYPIDNPGAVWFDINSDGEDDIKLWNHTAIVDPLCLSESGATITCGEGVRAMFQGWTNDFGQNLVNTNGNVADTIGIDCSGTVLDVNDSWGINSGIYFGCSLTELCYTMSYESHKQGFRLLVPNPANNTNAYLYGYIDYFLTNNGAVIVNGWYYESSFNQPISVDGGTVGINESTTSKNLIQILDLMGRETSFKPNTPLIYVYDDGSIEKVFSVEY